MWLMIFLLIRDVFSFLENTIFLQKITLKANGKDPL